jgi:hypothetical protein
MEPFDAPKPQHEETEPVWPPGMPDDAPESNGAYEAEPAPEPESWLSELPPEEPEAEVEAEAEAEAEPAPVAEEPTTVEDEASLVDDPEHDLPSYDTDDEDDAEAATLVGAPAVTAASDSGSRRLPSVPSLSKLRGANINVSLSSFEPRVIALIALLAVVAAVGLIVMRNRSSDTTTPQEPVPTKSVETKTPAATKPGTPTGFTHVAVAGGAYGVDVPTGFQRQVNGPLVTFSAADKSRAYALNGKASDDSGLNAVAKRLVAGYRDTYRLTAVKVDRSGADVRITAAGRRRGGTARQDIFAVVFHGKDGKGTFVLQRFTPRGKTASEDELNTVLASVTPTS